MMEFRVWSYRSGYFAPTDYWARATKLEHVEQSLYKAISKTGLPCIIVISKLNLEDNDKQVSKESTQ